MKNKLIKISYNLVLASLYIYVLLYYYDLVSFYGFTRTYNLGALLFIIICFCINIILFYKFSIEKISVKKFIFNYNIIFIFLFTYLFIYFYEIFTGFGLYISWVEFYVLYLIFGVFFNRLIFKKFPYLYTFTMVISSLITLWYLIFFIAISLR